MGCKAKLPLTFHLIVICCHTMAMWTTRWFSVEKNVSKNFARYPDP